MDAGENNFHTGMLLGSSASGEQAWDVRIRNLRRSPMERADWLKQMRSKAESLYDVISPQYWVLYGLVEEEAHEDYLDKFLRLVGQPGVILSAACGAGRIDGILLEAGHCVVGVDQSAGMLARAREHFSDVPAGRLRYEKMGLQEMNFQEVFDGAICMDAMEHICPEDWPVIVQGFARALKPGGVLYFTADHRDADELEAAYARARAKGLPVVYGEVADSVDEAYARAEAHPDDPHEVVDASVYHYIPSLEQVRTWLAQAGLAVEEVGVREDYYHIIARKG